MPEGYNLQAPTGLISPIDNLPYDILREIFILCHERPLIDDNRPINQITPISLCHVSSFWRMVALDCPALWSHLRLHMRVTMQYAEWAVHKGDIEFIQWWRRNQGARLPYLLIRMSFRSKIDNPNVYDVDGMNFVMEYLITAQYIHVRDTLFWSLLAHWTRSQSRPLFSNLRTLAGSNGFFNFGKFYNSQMFIGYASGAAPSSLRRLCMTYYTLERELIPTYWSMLTDISLHHTHITLGFSHSLIRSTPCLQSLCLDIPGLIPDAFSLDPISVRPPEFIHTNLKSIYITSIDNKFSVYLLLINLSLPALQTLWLSCSHEIWREYQSMTDLNTLLQFMPSLSILGLGSAFASLNFEYSPLRNPFASHVLMPVWAHTPRLTHLELASSYQFSLSGMEDNLDQFMRNTFMSENRWLALGSYGCPIQSITIVEEELDKMKDHAMKRLQELSEKIPYINWEITATSQVQESAFALDKLVKSM